MNTIIVTEKGLKVYQERSGLRGDNMLVAYRCKLCKKVWVRRNAQVGISCAVSHPDGECCHYSEREGGKAENLVVRTDEERDTNPMTPKGKASLVEEAVEEFRIKAKPGMNDYTSREWAEERLPLLRRFVNKEREAYHKNNGEGMTVTAEVLDALKAEIASLEKLHPDLITPDSPTQTVQDMQVSRTEAEVREWADSLGLDEHTPKKAR